MANRPHDLLRVIGVRLRRARLRAGLKQAGAAEALNVSQTLISNAERGQRRLKDVEIQEFAGLYGISMEALIGPITEADLLELEELEATADEDSPGSVLDGRRRHWRERRHHPDP